MEKNRLTFSDNQEQQEKRVCQRIELNRQVQIKLADGQIINGLTEDVSLGGLRVTIQDSFEYTGLKSVEQVVLLRIKFSDDQFSPEYPCTIVRFEADAVCLKLNKNNAASFGMMLTRGALKQMQV